ncbi:hypothetical protein ATE84_0942 [Aquimarina sp. MAR_2010_214]|uniref:hypothetical protein n=1 Tax=Aquimarina sp. MAR_2010_214 TaxID=1250026 RepID=UPI000C705C6F|nr:hypothetical protein [Aquimarina sp. MAR_2010_214]PKV48926.1 hypothetical protein ATE84_0942 [Aquimarina sp. MAR_2010_214]
MVLKTSSQFAKDFKSLKDVSLEEKVKHVLESIKNAKNIDGIPHFRKIRGNEKAYKMGIGFYYLVGIITSEQEITLMRLLHRDQVLQVIKNN